MNKQLQFFAATTALVLVGGLVYTLFGQRRISRVPSATIEKTESIPAQTSSTQSVIFDPLNATYIIDNVPVTLVNGRANVVQKRVKTVTAVFGLPTIGDLNGDRKNDGVVFLTQTMGGTGTFYYVAAAIQAASGAKGTNAIFIGDRITPHDVQLSNNHMTVSYLDRGFTEAMVANPSLYTILEITVDGMLLRQDAP